MAGAILMGILAQIMLPATGSGTLLLVAAGGTVGSLLDSILGATVQGMYVCGREGVQTEQHPVHRCGSPTLHSRGWRWLNNDWVNFICATTGALVACGLAALLRGLRANLG